MRSLARITWLVIGVVVLAVVATLLLRGPSTKQITAIFASTTSLNPGARVKILGVNVGTVTSIRPVGTSVRVRISYDSSIRLPADVRAVIVPPSIVGDRFIQLGPAYADGPVLPNNAQIGLDRTGVPLELDQVYRGIDDLSVALGPNGANKQGALSRLITASAENLRGNGALLNQTIRNLAGALSALASSSDNYAGTLANTARVTKTLAGNNQVIAQLVQNLAAVSVELNGQRSDIKGAVTDLSGALATVNSFVRQNSATLTRSISDLSSIATVLARHKDELAQNLDVAPVGLVSLMNIIVPGNWDITKPNATSVNGRTSSLNLRAALLNNLDTQLGQVLTSMCAQLPTAQAAQLAPFCNALRSTGGNLGTLLGSLLGSSK